MSKAILVMDMPSSCSKCVAYESGGYNERLEPYDGACYIAKHCMQGHKVTKGRPSWCPLRELPQKINEKDYTSLIRIGEKKGWNACIDEIMKGSEENG